jgi:hypothetical protein
MPPIVRAPYPEIQQDGSSPMRDGVYKSWFRVNGIPGPVESPALGISTNNPLINRFVRQFPFGGIKALSQVMEATPDSAGVRAAWALIEILYAGHPDWLHAIRAPDCDPLDDWAMGHRARLLADLTELGGRASSEVMTYDDLRELAYMVATMTDEQEQLAALVNERHL